MARLNELPGPTESIEALKRRFVRQNREIARVNSLQSLRIQGLESEITQLLKENAALKEQVISLSHDAQKYEAGRFLCKDIVQYKDKLASRLSELNSLVSEFGKLPEKFLNSVDAANNANAMDGYAATDIGRRSITRPEDESRLPTILEDKYFPRRTLDIKDIENVAEDLQDLDSPNIGPPPVAHFDVDESLFSDPRPSDPEIARYTSVDTENQQEQTSNQSLGEFDDHQVRSRKSAKVFEIPRPPVISGSKRKFSATDEEENLVTSNLAIDDDFEYTRPVTGPRKSQPNTTLEVSNKSHGTAGSERMQKRKPNLPKRKVLEPKSTNMIASSPRKQPGSDITKEKAKGQDIPPIKHQNETVIVNRVELPNDEWTQSAPPKRGTQSHDREQRPTTSASNRLELLESCNEIKKSPGPTAKDEQPITDAGHPARQSRRQRGTVSYAEPNLRHKMRRSTNELMDAVVPGQRRVSSSQTDRFNQEDAEPLNSTKNERKSTPVNNEHSVFSSTYDDRSGINTATVGSENSQKLADIPKNMITERKRRTLSANPGELTRSQEHDPQPGMKQKRRSDQAPSNRSDRNTETNTSAHLQRQRQTTHRHSSVAEVYDHASLSCDDSLGDDETNENSDSKTSIESPDSGRDKQVTRKSAHALAASENTQATRSLRAAARRKSMLL